MGFPPAYAADARLEAYPTKRRGQGPIGLCLALMVASAMSVGCDRSPPAADPPPAAVATADAPQPSDAAIVPQAEPDPQPEPAAATDRPIDPASDSPSDPAPDPQPEPAPPTPAGAVHRILTPTTAGPLLVELQILIGQQPLDAARDHYIAHSLTTADKNGNRRTGWQEWLDALASDPALAGGQRIEEAQRRDLIQNYDINRNDHVEADEAARFLVRSGGVTGAMTLTGTAAMRHRNRSESVLFQLLDSDPDRRLTGDELAAAARRLRTLDQDGDDLLSAAELTSVAIARDPSWRRGSQAGRSDLPVALSGFTDWRLLGYALAGMRGGRSMADEIGEPYNLVDRLDADGDETFSAAEAEALATVPPHLRVRIRFPAVAGKQADPLIDRVDAPTPLDGAAIDVDPRGRLSLTLPGLRWTLMIKDVPGPAPAIWMNQVRARASEVPDAVADWLDGDHDGRLTTREIQSAADRLRAIDAGEDGAISSDEIPDAYRVYLVRGNPLQDEQHFAASSASAPLDPSRPAWAAAMDANRDGDISPGEFLGDRAQFDNLDSDSDRFLDAAEVLDAAETPSP